MTASETPPARLELDVCLGEVLPHVQAADPAGGGAAARALEVAVPFDGPLVGRLRRILARGVDEGWLLPKSAGPRVRFGRLAKDMGGYAVDCVLMQDGSGMGHTHVKGEINMCFAWEGEPRFDGHPPGWVVFPPGSHHRPTVTGGTMLFVYFTPEGAVVWDAK